MKLIDVNTAKRIKEFGYNEKVIAFFNECGVNQLAYPTSLKYEGNYPALTIDEACDYFFDNFSLHIAVDYIGDNWVATVTRVPESSKLPERWEADSKYEAYNKAIVGLCDLLKS